MLPCRPPILATRFANARQDPLGWLVLAALVVGGLWIRYADIRGQLVGGDEYHAIRVARDHELAEIFTFYEEAENSIPLTLYTRSLMETVGLTEFRFRLPAMISGIALLLAPLVLRRRLGASATLVAVALLATSPMAIYYAFVGRPYGPAAALLIAALFSWWRWLRAPSAGWLALFVTSAALAVFFHLLCLFPVGGLVGLSWIAARRAEGPRPRRVLGMTVLLLLAGLALFGPGLDGLVDVRILNSERPGVGTPQLAWWAFVRLSGEHAGAAAVLLLLAAIGSIRLVARHGLLGLALAGLLPAVVAGMFITQPFPKLGAWTRYLFLAWPTFLMTASVGVVAVLDEVRRKLVGRRPLALLGLAIGLAAVLAHGGGGGGSAAAARTWLPWFPGLMLIVAAGGALLSRDRHEQAMPATTGAHAERSSVPVALLSLFLAAGAIAWTPVAIFQPGPDNLRVRSDSVRRVSADTRRQWAADVSPFFWRLAEAQDAGEILLVWPYRQQTVLWRPFVKQQTIHGMRIVAVHERTLKDMQSAGIHFENIADIKHVNDLVDEGARYLVQYLPYVEGHDWDLEADLARFNRPVKASFFSSFQSWLERRHGPPVYRDEQIQVFDLWIEWPPSAR